MKGEAMKAGAKKCPRPPRVCKELTRRAAGVLRSAEICLPVGIATRKAGDQGEVDDVHDAWRRVPF
jgi:hypothetical protein